MRRLFQALAGSLVGVAFALAVTGCGTQVDPAELEAIDPNLSAKNYKTTWGEPVRVGGFVPGHKDSARVIYANKIAREYPHYGRYPEGSVLVKEVRSKTTDGTEGSLHELVIMRKTRRPPPGVPTQGGWIFSVASSTASVDSGASEESFELCWNTCHSAGSVDGAWADYGN